MRGAQALDAVAIATSRRRTGATALSAASSRSFVDCCLRLARTHPPSADAPHGSASHASLHILDLAGSERQAQTCAAGATLKESSANNTALSVLARVVAARAAAERPARRAPSQASPASAASSPSHAASPSHGAARASASAASSSHAASPLERSEPPQATDHSPAGRAAHGLSPPYDDAVLTRLIKPALSGRAALLIFVCVSQARSPNQLQGGHLTNAPTKGADKPPAAVT